MHMNTLNHLCRSTPTYNVVSRTACTPFRNHKSCALCSRLGIVTVTRLFLTANFLHFFSLLKQGNIITRIFFFFSSSSSSFFLSIFICNLLSSGKTKQTNKIENTRAWKRSFIFYSAIIWSFFHFSLWSDDRWKVKTRRKMLPPLLKDHIEFLILNYESGPLLLKHS